MYTFDIICWDITKSNKRFYSMIFRQSCKTF